MLLFSQLPGDMRHRQLTVLQQGYEGLSCSQLRILLGKTVSRVLTLGHRVRARDKALTLESVQLRPYPMWHSLRALSS
jgi:DNA-binding CsgD family transcriptional regulator